jgi:hypothetical protein
MTEKKCSKCKQIKELAEFHKNKRSPDGHQSYCKPCKRQHNNEPAFRKYLKDWRDKATPCLYRIRHKQTGEYYLGQTRTRFCDRVASHFTLNANVASPFTGKNRKDYECEVICYGTLDQIKQVEKELLSLRVGIDPKCLNKYRSRH